jgi:hypothetical protein
MMENTAIILIAVTLFLLVIILGLLTLVVMKLFKQRPPLLQDQGDKITQPPLARSEFHPDILERMKQMEKIKPKRADLFCPHHSEEPGEVMCSICDKLFCKACIKPFKTMHFCKEHLSLMMRFDWAEVLTIKTSTTDPEQGVRLFDVKKELFEKDNIPTFVETHYKINVDQDFIETYLVLFAVKEEVEKLREKLKVHSFH